MVGNQRQSKRLVASAAAALSLLAAACGSSSSVSKSTATTGAATATTSSGSSTSAPVTISVWTAFNGVLGKAFNRLVTQFNSSQSTYHVVATYKGSYTQVLSDTIAAFRAHAAPDITQIFDAGTATIMDATGTYMPVYKLMAQNHIPFATSDFVGGAASYYETSTNKLDSLPFNSSTPVLFYNKTEFAKAGITVPPKTWQQLQTDAATLSSHGQRCALTTSGAYVMWSDMEQFAVWNGYPYASNQNGYTAIKGVKLLIDTPPFIAHLAMLGQMASKGQYIWNGVSTSTVPLFTNGTCAMYEQSSADLSTIQAGAKFPFGVSELPIVAGDTAAPQNTVVGGASLWVMAGAPANTYPGDAKFLAYLMSAAGQADWASHTGYVPVTPAGSQLLASQNFYKTHPNDQVAVSELNNKPPTPNSRGIRLGYLPQIRQAEASAIAEVLSGKQTASQALATAQKQGDAILNQFAAQYGG